MKPVAQRCALALCVEMAPAHVTEVTTYFQYCRKVTLCLSGKSTNYNLTATTKCSAAPSRFGEETQVNSV